MSDIDLLIIDADKSRKQYLNNILLFADVGTFEFVPFDKWRGHFSDGASPGAVWIGSTTDSGRLLGTVRQLHELDRRLPVFVLSDSHHPSEKDEALDREILGMLTLPLREYQLKNALHRAQIYREQQQGSDDARPVELFRSLVGNSRAIREIRHAMEQVADSEVTVLILGESGTGKEVVARNLHYHSARRKQAFVPINCGAIPSELLESELFGHEKGAFTGAISTRRGRFEMAEGGTLFLDEIGDMSLSMQVKLLRVLQERTFERVGSNKVMEANVRIIAATHRDLEEKISEGKFREDLYYRLNVFPIYMPPLRERMEDIPLLINELITRIEHEKRGAVRLTPEAIMALCQYRWSGNVRELANLMERLVIMYPFRVVDVADLPEKYQPEGVVAKRHGSLTRLPQEVLEFSRSTPEVSRLPSGGMDLREHLAHLEFSLIQQALKESNGVVAHAAKLLSMRRTTLVEKLRKYGYKSDSRRDFDKQSANVS